MNNINKKQKIVFGIIVIFVFLVSASITYAYFDTEYEGFEKNQIVTTGTLSIDFQDGNNINIPNLEPGMSFGKEIVITNTGTIPTYYNLKWENLTNEIINNEMHYFIDCRNYSEYNGFDWTDYIESDYTNESESEGNVFIDYGEYVSDRPIINNINVSLLNHIFIEPQTTHACYIEFYFIETGEVQNYNQGKIFGGKLKVVEGKEESMLSLSGQIIDSSNNPITGATVAFDSTPETVVTDANGNYNIDSIYPVEQVMTVKDSTNQIILEDTITINKSNITEVVDANTINYVPSETYYRLITKLSNSNNIESNEFSLEYTPESCFTTSGNSITRYSSSCPKKVAIPSTISGTVINEIAVNAFCERQVTNVLIPNSVTTISYRAFRDNKLLSLTIPNSVTYIGTGAFNSNELPDDQAFIYARTDTNSDGIAEIDTTTVIGYGGAKKDNVRIPDGVTTIGNSAFFAGLSYYYDNIRSIIIPNGVTSIGDSAFRNNELSSLTIPNSVTYIGQNAFMNNDIEIINENYFDNIDENYTISAFAFGGNPICDAPSPSIAPYCVIRPE